jgi:hypothetical protein
MQSEPEKKIRKFKKPFIIHAANSARFIVPWKYWGTVHSRNSGFSRCYSVPIIPVILSFRWFHMSGGSICPVVPYVRSFHMSLRSICPVVLAFLQLSWPLLTKEINTKKRTQQFSYCKSSRILILLLQTETEIRFFYQCCMSNGK